MREYERLFLDFLWEAGALRIGDFTLKSGRKSPFFLNTGLLDTGARMRRLGQAYAATLADRVGTDRFDVVFGPAYKGIPIAVATAVALAERGIERAFLSDRKEGKEHGAEAGSGGMAKHIVGRLPAQDARFVLVDDVLTDGATKFAAVEFLRRLAPNGRIVALLVVLDRQETRADGSDALSHFATASGVPVVPVLRLTEVLDVLAASKRITSQDLERCRAYWSEYGTAAAREWAGALRRT